MKHKKLLLVSLLLLIFIGSQSVYGQMPDSLEYGSNGSADKIASSMVGSDSRIVISHPTIDMFQLFSCRKSIFSPQS
jgi:hypothetical protein